MVDLSSVPSWVWWAGGTVVAAGAWYWWSSSQSSQSADSGATTDPGYAAAYPTMTYASAPALGGSDLGASAGDTGGLTALSSLMTSLAGPTQQEITDQVNAATAAGVAQGQQTASVGVFNSLVAYLNAHKGLKNISAIVPGVGTVQVGPTPTKVITQTKIKYVPKPVAPKPAPKPVPKPAAHVVAIKPAAHAAAVAKSSHTVSAAVHK